MSDMYHVIVLKTSGELVQSDKETEISAIKSAKAYVTLRKEQAAIVANEGQIIFSIPENLDKKFITSAMAMIGAPSAPAARPKTIANIRPELEAFPIEERMAKHDAAVKSGKVVIPKTKPKLNACDIDILESACLALSLSRGVPVQTAQKICEQNHIEIEEIATKIGARAISRQEAIQQVVSMVLKKMRPEIPPSDSGEAIQDTIRIKTASPLVNQHHLSYQDRSIPVTSKTIRFTDMDEEDLFRSHAPTSMEDGIKIYNTKDIDNDIHIYIAALHGYKPQNWINSHRPSNIPGYDYKWVISTSRKNIKTPTWTASGGRIEFPSKVVAELNTRFSNKILIVVAPEVNLA